MYQYKAFLVDDDFNVYSARTKMMLSPHVGSDGYIQVECRGEDHKLIHERLHVIYAHIFIPNPNGYKYINHIDSDKTNNSIDNLEWCSNSYNVKHGWNSGHRTHRNRTHVRVTFVDGSEREYPSIRKLSDDLHLDRHKVARILKEEIPNRFDYQFDYVM